MFLSDAYVAGLIDGEGCIYLSPSGRESRNRAMRKGFSVSLEIGMTLAAKPVLTALHHQYGGYLGMAREATEKWSESWHWKLQGEPAATLLQALLPHLVIKKPQAELAVMAEAIRKTLIPNGQTRARWTQQSHDQVKELRERVMELNRKGPSIPAERKPFALLVGDAWMIPQLNLFGEMQWEQFSEAWPLSGMISHGVAWTHSGLEWPNDAVVCSLSDILEPEVDSKYFLSPKACKGILRRAEKRGRELPLALMEALTQIAKQSTDD